MSNHFITLAQAEAMISRFQIEKDNILIPSMQNKGILFTSETFEREAFDIVLGEAGVAGLRFYLGMNELLETRLIAVAIDAEGNDILPDSASSRAYTVTSLSGHVIEEGTRCPTNCPKGLQLGQS